MSIIINIVSVRTLFVRKKIFPIRIRKKNDNNFSGPSVLPIGSEQRVRYPRQLGYTEMQHTEFRCRIRSGHRLAGQPGKLFQSRRKKRYTMDETRRRLTLKLTPLKFSAHLDLSTVHLVIMINEKYNSKKNGQRAAKSTSSKSAIVRRVISELIACGYLLHAYHI